MNSLPAHRSTQGFTLLEILIATAVSAIVLLVVQGVFFGALRLRNSADRQLAASIPLQHALGIIAADLRGATLPGGTLSGDFRTDADFGLFSSSGEGTPIGPTFGTTTGRIDARTPFAEVQRVSYRLVAMADPSSGYTLVRDAERNLLTIAYEYPFEQPLLDSVVDAGFDYFDGTDWIDSWDSETADSLPSAVRFWVQQLSDAPNDTTALPAIEIVVPILVTTASTAESAVL